MKHMRRYIARTVLVNTERESFRGTLAAASAEGVEIDHVTVIEPTQTEITGSVFVPVAAVTWIQVV